MKRESYIGNNFAESIIEEIRKETKLKSVDWPSIRAALLVVDMQDYFVREGAHSFLPSAPAIVPQVNGLIEATRTAGLPVVLTQHINSEGDACMMKNWWGDYISEMDSESSIAASVQSREAVIFRKTQYDAFFLTGLDEYLREREIDTVIICGLVCHLCIETTARSAFVRGYRVIVAADAVCDYNRRVHANTLLSLAHGFAHIATSQEIAIGITK